MARRDDIVRAARGWIGTPYQHQASLIGIGTDCLGLVRGVWRQLFGDEPERLTAYGPGWAESGGQEALADAARRHLIEIEPADFRDGDVLLFRWRPHLPAKHAGIAVSTGRMIHAQEHVAVTEIAIGNWWRRHLSHAFRFPGVDD